MGEDLEIREVPEDVLAALAVRAAAEGRSVSDYVREQIILAHSPETPQLGSA